jgi:ClpP class serine protease
MDIAKNRRIPREKLRALINEGPFSSESACHHGMIDGLFYADEVLEYAKKKAEENLIQNTTISLPGLRAKLGNPLMECRFLSLAKYHNLNTIPWTVSYFRTRSKVALIHCKGPIE